MPLALATFDNAPALDRALADAVAARLTVAIAANGKASLVVSGGRTPVDMLERLSCAQIRWDAVTVTLADERWVEPGHADSNERMVRTHLLRNAAAAARFVPLKNSAATPEAGTAATAAASNSIARPFDVVLLGMGDDAHTASLFPGAAELEAGLTTAAPCLAVHPLHAPHARMSLSLNSLLDSRSIVVQIAGAGKRSVIERAAEPGPVEDMPIRAILRQRKTPVEIYWCP
jgi:6-phosphogluconolactonase